MRWPTTRDGSGRLAEPVFVDPPSPRPGRLLRVLPGAHAEALLLRSAGADDGAIAAAVGIPVESVPALLAVAVAKLAAATATDGPEAHPAPSRDGSEPTGA